MATVKRIFFVIVLLLICGGAIAAERPGVFEGVEPKAGPRDFGILFSTNDLLLDIQGFQGGVGAKIGLTGWMLRGTADIVLNTECDPFSMDLGAVLEKHIWPGPLSVYWGPLAGVGFTTILLFKTDADNWSRINTFPLSLGCVFGIELFLFEFLSVFIEYQAALKLGIDSTRVSTAGSVTADREFTYNFDIGMGNNAMFGIVIYLMRRDETWQPESAEQEQHAEE